VVMSMLRLHRSGMALIKIFLACATLACLAVTASALLPGNTGFSMGHNAPAGGQQMYPGALPQGYTGPRNPFGGAGGGTGSVNIEPTTPPTIPNPDMGPNAWPGLYNNRPTGTPIPNPDIGPKAWPGLYNNPGAGQTGGPVAGSGGQNPQGGNGQQMYPGYLPQGYTGPRNPFGGAA